jgi:hypothetical protein
MTRATIYGNERHWSWLLNIFAGHAHSLRREVKLYKECREKEDLRADFRISEICIRDVTETILSSGSLHFSQGSKTIKYRIVYCLLCRGNSGFRPRNR